MYRTIDELANGGNFYRSHRKSQAKASRKETENPLYQALHEKDDRAIAGYRILIGEDFPVDLNLVRKGLAKLLRKRHLSMEEFALYDAKNLEKILRQNNLNHVIKNAKAIKEFLHSSSIHPPKRTSGDSHKLYARLLRKEYRLSNSTKLVLG